VNEMLYKESHLSDEQLLQFLDGESSARQAKRIQSHLSECWTCRSRQRELENAIAEFVRAYQQEQDAEMPPIAGPRAILKARLSQAAIVSPAGSLNWLSSRRGSSWAFAALSLVCLLLGFLLAHSIKLREVSTSPSRIPASRLARYVL